MTTLDRLATEKYVLLTTFRKDGRPVATPVWAVRDGDALAVWTVTDSGKVKRVRRNGEVTVGACDVRGNPQGEPAAGHAVVADFSENPRIRGLLAGKYGLQARVLTWFSRVRRGPEGTIVVRIRFAD